MLQFFLQTFVTFKLGRDGKFWTLFWMWKEFILLIFLVSIIRYITANMKKRIKTQKKKSPANKYIYLYQNMNKKINQLKLKKEKNNQNSSYNIFVYS